MAVRPDDIESSIRIVENGEAVGSQAALIPSAGRASLQTPTLGIAEGQPRRVGEEIVFRGQSLAFGAGTVEAIALVYLGTAEVTQGALSSRGLPVPGW